MNIGFHTSIKFRYKIRTLARLMLTIVLVSVGLTSIVVVPLSDIASKGGDAWGSMPSELKIFPSPQRTQVYASDGKTLIAVFYDENRHDVILNNISPHMRNAIVASEDQHFYTHKGFDIKGILRAFIANARGEDTQGASTITQQYVRQALTYYATTPEDVIKATEETPQRKIREIKYAVSLEKKYTKDQILELYLNIAFFGHGAYGVYAASQVYFNKTPDKLSAAEASLLAGLVKSPSSYDPADKYKRQLALERREYVLSQMVKTGSLTQVDVDAAEKGPLKFYGKETPEGCISTYEVTKYGAGFFCDYLRRWWLNNPAFGRNEYERQVKLTQGGFTVISTLDVHTQQAAHRYARNQPNIVPPNQRQTVYSKNAEMLVAIEPGSGRVMAMATNRNFSNDQSRNGTNTNYYRRGTKGNYPNTTVPILTGSPQVPGYQAGSVFKIFTVVAALEKGYSANFVINSRSQFISKYPVQKGCDGKYCVKNAKPEWMNGMRNMYTGFGRSVNTYFVPLEQKVGPERAVDAAKRMGIQFSARGSKNYPSDYEFARNNNLARSWGPFTLGVTSVTPLELANAYATIAADGKYCTPSPVTALIDRYGVRIDLKPICHQTVDTRIARMAVDVARCPVGDKAKYGKCDGGTAAYVRQIVGRPVAGKSGTTDSERTATFVAMTPQMAVAGMLADTDNPMTNRKMKHPPINFAVTYTLRDGVRNKLVRNF